MTMTAAEQLLSVHERALNTPLDIERGAQRMFYEWQTLVSIVYRARQGRSAEALRKAENDLATNGAKLRTFIAFHKLEGTQFDPDKESLS